MKNKLNKSIHPCTKCPYKLGLVRTVVNPCPQCKQNGYSFYKQYTQNKVKDK